LKDSGGSGCIPLVSKAGRSGPTGDNESRIVTGPEGKPPVEPGLLGALRQVGDCVPNGNGPSGIEPDIELSRIERFHRFTRVK
jgi:hypothetical protein